MSLQPFVLTKKTPGMFQNLDKLEVSSSLAARKGSLCLETSQGSILLWDVLVSIFKKKNTLGHTNSKSDKDKVPHAPNVHLL